MLDRVRFVRVITVNEYTSAYERDQVPASLHGLFDGSLTVADLTAEQRDDLDDLLANDDYKLGDTADSEDWELDLY